MSKQDSLFINDKQEELNYAELIKKHHWIVKKNQNCILSPDSDGLLCGLFMSHFLGWKIKGFYDGKVLLLDKKLKVKDCVFLDMEIFKKEIKSVGHHMVLFNKRREYANWNNFENCIQPNNLRNFDGYTNFGIKYPLATIHLLIGIIGSVKNIKIPESAICPLLYTDGVFKNLFNYPENCIDWLMYLKANNKKSALHKIFMSKYYSIHDLMLALKSFFNDIASVGENKRGNDKIKISNTQGEATNLTEERGICAIKGDEVMKAEKFIKLLASLTGWSFKNKDWQWSNFILKKFKKGTISPTNTNFEEIISKKPISWAMISGLAVEYTLDPKKILLK